MLFRPEAIEFRTDRLSGDVAIAVPVAWQAIGTLLFGGVAATLIFLSLASYSRVETVAGVITPDAGVATIVPTRNGVIAALSVRDGQQVAAGAQLALVRSEEYGATGPSTAAQIEAAIARQDASLGAQLDAAQVAARAQLGQLAAQRTGLAPRSASSVRSWTCSANWWHRRKRISSVPAP